MKALTETPRKASQITNTVGLFGKEKRVKMQQTEVGGGK